MSPEIVFITPLCYWVLRVVSKVLLGSYKVAQWASDLLLASVADCRGRGYDRVIQMHWQLGHL